MSIVACVQHQRSPAQWADDQVGSPMQDGQIDEVASHGILLEMLA